MSDGSQAQEHDPSDLRHAWQTHEEEIRAVILPDSANLNPGGDVLRLASNALAVADVLRPHVDAIQARAPALDFGQAKLDRLTSLARAMTWIQLEIGAISTEDHTLDSLRKEAAATRTRLALALRAKLATKPADTRRRVPTIAGRRIADWGVAIQALILCLEAEGLDGTPLTPDDLDAAAHLVTRLVVATPVERGRSPALVEAWVLRKKALVVLQEHYEAVRAVVWFVFREERAKQGRNGEIWTRVPGFWQARKLKGERVG